eukprot:8169681-Alexandrium_andersonii.AAC.1
MCSGRAPALALGAAPGSSRGLHGSSDCACGRHAQSWPAGALPRPHQQEGDEAVVAVAGEEA